MSADLLSLAARAVETYAKVRGPWAPPTRVIFIEPTPYTRWCTVRAVREAHPGQHGEAVYFDPVARKEMTSMPEASDQNAPAPSWEELGTVDRLELLRRALLDLDRRVGKLEANQ